MVAHPALATELQAQTTEPLVLDTGPPTRATTLLIPATALLARVLATMPQILVMAHQDKTQATMPPIPATTPRTTTLEAAEDYQVRTIHGILHLNRR